MGSELTVVIPFYNGHQYIDKLVRSIPQDISIIIVDDLSEENLYNRWTGSNKLSESSVSIIRMEKKGYFTGAVNVGIAACDTDVLVLNQDTWFDGIGWLALIQESSQEYAMIGERISGTHPSFGSLGYIHGTFMYLRRDAIKAVGPLNEKDYPLWGATAEYQWRVARHGFGVFPVKVIPNFHHERGTEERYGSSIRGLLDRTPTTEKFNLVRTPPLLSVIVPCYNYGRYVSDCVASLIGGRSSLGEMAPQTLQSFEVIIVDDAGKSKDWPFIEAVTSEAKGIRSYRLENNLGTAGALNFGIEKAVGQYITFLSADDMRESDSLESLVRSCQANPHSFAYDDIMLFVRNKRVKEWRMQDYDFEELLQKNHVHAGIVFPKTAWTEVGGYPKVMRDGREDWAFNVALGIHGWCGEHIHQPGYLYRREHQNRSLSNTSPAYYEKFLHKISGLFPEVYGGYRPAMCCGKKPKAPGQPSIQRVSEPGLRKSVTSNNMSGGGSNLMAASTGAPGMVPLKYKGKQQPTVWDGGVTNTRYRFGIGKEFGWVDIRDAGEKGKRGFLNLKDSQGNFLFEVDGSTESPVEQKVAKPIQRDVKVVIGDAPRTVAGEDVAVLDLPVETAEVVEEEGDSPTLPMVSSVDFPNPSEYNAKEIMAMELTRTQWHSLYSAELAAEKPRKSLLTWLEEKLASV